MDISRVVENEVSENPIFRFDADVVAQALVSRIISGRGGFQLDEDLKEDALDDGMEAAIELFEGEDYKRAYEELREKVKSHLENEVKEIALAILCQLANDAAKKAEAEEAEAVA